MDADEEINIPYEMWFDVDKYFGTKTRDIDSWINFYTCWQKDGTITAEYVVDYPDKIESFTWELTEEEKTFFARKMESYCLSKHGCTLLELMKKDE